MTKIAIVGMAFRFPGDIDNEDTFWDVLKAARDVVGEVNLDRWGIDVYSHPRRNEPGRSITFSAGLLSRVDEFDAAFFGISPREARQMDPQQRLLLEMTWEALENGGQVPDKLSGSDCAVYIGISGLDYGLRSVDDLSAADAYTMTGNTLSIAANRISYVFDLHGPSMAIDTACSSSMVALHQACQSLRNGESRLAIAGGVSLLLHPYPFVGFTKASMLSAEGRCKTFDASGDGYVRGEGGAILLLKPYEQALADGDLIHAVILGTGVNTDGYKSGITIPSATAQTELMRNVCRQAGIAPKDIVYIEAHGTGTAVGDPIETAAIGEAIGKAKLDEQPLYIGSVKSNMGHLEPASGMAGLLKTVLCLKQRALPASLHLETPNPNIDFAGLNLKPVTELVPLPKSATPLRMGVNSFGFGGANAHVLLEEAPSIVPAKRKRIGATPPLFLSARHPNALKALAARYAARIETEAAKAYYDLAASTAFRRQPLDQGLAIFGDSPRIIAKRLRGYADGQAPAGLVQEDRLPTAAKLAFVYSGNGAQWLGMGRQLMQESASFRGTIEEIDALLAPLVKFSLLEELNREAGTARLHLTEIAQPALFAMQVGLTRLLREQGLDADAATGHSVGEVAAAWATGALTLEQAVRVIHERSAAQALTQGAGRMAAVALSAQDVQAAITQAGLTDELEIAGINAPNQVTLSGNLMALEQLHAALQPSGVFFRLLDFDYAFHSRHMEPIRKRILADLANLEPATGTGRFVSTVHGAAFDGAKLDAEYWWKNVRQPVQFAKAIGSLIQDGYTVFLEIGPNAILQRYLGECLNAAKSTGRALAMLRQNEESLDRVLEATYRARLLGCPLDLSKAFPVAYNFVPLPAYPWQRERHWYGKTSEAYELINRHRVHPLLGYRLKDGEALWENQLDPHVVSYLRDHVVGGAIVLPGTAYAELALAASAEYFGTANAEFEELEIRTTILLDEDHTRTIRFELNPQDGGFQIKSRTRLSDEPWTVNAVGRLVGASLAAQPDGVDLTNAMQAAPVVDSVQHYRLCHELGLNFGPAFQGFKQAWSDGDAILAELVLPAAAAESADKHILHPVLADACFQTLLALLRAEIEAGRRAVLLPVRIGRLRMFGDGSTARYCQTRMVKHSPHSVLADFRMLDAEGRVIAELLGCRFRGAPIALHRQHKAAEWVYTAYLKPRPDVEAISPIPAARILKDVAIQDLVQAEAALHRSEHFDRTLPLFEALVSSFAHQACLTLADAERRLPNDFIAAEAEGSPRLAFRQWLMTMLEEDGLAEQTDKGWVLAEEAPAAPQDIWLSILGDNPAYMPDLALAGRMGMHLPAALADADDNRVCDEHAPGSTALMEQMLEASPSYTGANRMARTIAAHIAAQWPDNRRLRVLELGCCSRALTRALLPLLPEARCDYVIAELNDEALAHAEAEFADHAQVSCVKLDADTLLAEDDEAIGPGFDLVVSGHVLHALTEPALAITQLKRKLNKGGLLLLLERPHDRLADFIFALAKNGWTPHGSRLLSSSDWMQLFGEAGYSDIEVIIEPAASPASPGAFILLAKNPDAPATAIEGKPASSKWLLLNDRDGEASVFAKALSTHLIEQGQRATVADIEAPLPDLAHFDRIVHLAGLSVDNDTRDVDLMASQERRCISTLALIHAIEASKREVSPKLWLVTGHGAVVTRADGQPLPTRQIPSQAALWGFGRVIMNEHPDLACKLVDLRFDSLNEETVAALCAELLSPDDEDEIILSAARRVATRMQPLERPATTDSDTENVCLDFHIPGQLRNLQWHRKALLAPAADEIEIHPMAVGLNFRDVMYAMGLLSDEAVENGFAGPTMGMELSGTVTRVGKAVTEFKVGDAVVAFAPAGFARRAITKAESAVKKPDAWSFEEAATVPAVFFTVYYALHHLARLQPGEKILIHGAAGGVGIAAIQVARHLGAEIFATAGSDEKRDFVRLLGADHVMNSRSLSYADEIMAITQGKGIDVVLNSLAGEAINRNFRVLRPFGRFLELGKRDFYENTKIGLRPFKDNITYYGIDADQLMVERPELTTRLFREMMRLFDEGVLRPLPYRVFPANRIVEAYRYMQQAKQIGKIVVSFAEGVPQAAVTHAKAIKPVFSRDGTYLVTGGLGGFGLKTARWLAEQGAGHLLLVSRRGDRTPGAAAAVAELEAAGATVHIRACDVTDVARLQALINDIPQTLPPLKGVVHAAMVLDDGLIRNLDRTRFNAALRPKMLGAWNLHRLTLHLPLELFVVYSSATTFIGNPGQANYVAANLYLEALIALRRAKGLPGTSVCWGAIGDVGYLARNEEIKEALQSRLGGKALDSNQALQQLGEMIVSGRSGVAIIDFDWHTLSLFLSATRSPRFDKLRRAAGKCNDMGETEDIHALIANHTEDEVREILQALLTKEIAEILRLPPERIPLDRSLYDIGMDSLMGVELVLGIEKRFGINLPIMALSEGPTITRITERLLKQLLHDGDTELSTSENSQTIVTLSSMAAQHGIEASAHDLDQAMAELKTLASASDRAR